MGFQEVGNFGLSMELVLQDSRSHIQARLAGAMEFGL
jgi:hypothetical protein